MATTPEMTTMPQVAPAPGWLTRHPGLRRALLLMAKLTPLGGVVVAVAAWSHLPRMHVGPALAGLACWTVGNYLFCPLRWRAVSARGQRLRWYARVYAEGELLGMLTPQHAGADLWRIKQLLSVGADKTGAVVEIAADRLSGGVIVTILALIAGMEVPPRFWPLAGGAVALVAFAAWATRRWWQPRVAGISRPRGRALVRGALISALYQAGYVGFTLGLVAAVGHHVNVLDTAGLVGLSQAAGLLPGVHGAGPREGTLAGGLVALGLPLSAAFSAVALGVALSWVPAVVVGGGGLAARGLRRRRAAGALLPDPA